MQTFCTIITADHFPKAVALYRSIREFNKNMLLHVFVSDDQAVVKKNTGMEGIKIIGTRELSEYSFVRSLYKKYAHINMDHFRWSMKPVLASYLLRNGYEKVVYTDCDMFFVNNYDFLLNELNDWAVLLTPHWKNTDPLIDKESFLSNFTSGIFSAGFFAANPEGLPALDWWAHACHFMMGPHIELGIHDDQRYLDILPVNFENVKIIRHRGCNIGSWNYEASVRSYADGRVIINNKYPVIFLHFDQMLISTILKGHDGYLAVYLEKYRKTFEEDGYQLSDFITNLERLTNANLMLRIKWNLKIRTRIKRFLYRQAESL